MFAIYLLLLALLCAFHSSPLCEAAVCYVKPTEPHNATCPSEPCHTLDEYVSNSTRYFVSNTVFMFLTGNHHLSLDLTVFDAHNITLQSCIERSHVVIESESNHVFSLMFESVSNIIMKDMTFLSLVIRFENSTTVTLAGLTAESNAAVVLNNVFGAVTISHFKSENCTHTNNCIAFKWTVPYYIQNTEVLLHELNLHSLDGKQKGVSISGCIPGSMIVNNSTFNNLNMYMELPICSNMWLMINETYFCNLYGGLNILVQTSKPCYKQKMAFTLHNVSFTDNYLATVLYNVQNITIRNCSFTRKNSHSEVAIQAISSVLSFKGKVTFIKNDNYLSYKGGAISLFADSRILVPEPLNTHIIFENNYSNKVGGAIYFASPTVLFEQPGYCKLYIEQIFNKTVFSFFMNTALNGGNAIYGANLQEPCYSPNGTLIKNLSQIFLHVSSFYPSFTDDLSVISSDAHSVCLCNEVEELGDCIGTNFYVYPGQVFMRPVAAIGDMKGLVKWPVFAEAIDAKLGNTLQQSQTTNAQRCSKFPYSILSNRTWTLICYSVKTAYYPTNRHCDAVYLLDCPLGFTLSRNYGCECHKSLSQSIENIHCNITQQSIERQGTTWIGILKKNESNATLLFSTVCPFLFCNKSATLIYINDSFHDEDNQCVDNRSGVLCGGCRDNFSLAVGSNRCLHNCSDNNLSLIIVFAAAGIALVFFIKILNLTVSQGTINGLIFYANIIWVEQTMTFTSEKFLSVFLAWVNLDFGIETCFFYKMDAYTKSWLQFVFPAYVWAIALIIIIFSHYSIRASKLFGNNSVPVLATLILLSYSKLLRAVISALSVTNIQFLNGSTMSVWERDGNIQYLTGKHIPLFVFAVAVLVLLWLPFTLVLVSIQWLQRGTHYRVLRWVIKLRPFFDAFTGPLKDKHRYWVGTLLLVRCSLLLVFYIYTANGSGVAFISIIFVIIIILVYLASVGLVYRNYLLAVLELSYILNLGLFATGSLYVLYINHRGNMEALVITSVGITFLQFLATVLYHAYIQLREPLKKLKFITMQLEKLKIRMNWLKDTENISGPQHEEYEPLDGASYSVEPLQQPPFQEIPNFREPLLGYLND